MNDDLPEATEELAAPCGDLEDRDAALIAACYAIVATALSAAILLVSS
jgi:hypothetical protein